MKKVVKKKLTFIVPIVAVLVLVGGAIAVQQFTKEARQPDDTAATSIATEDIPQYAACELVTTNTIKATFGASKITQVREGQRIGETAPNGTIAESCRYTFSTEASNNNSFTVSVYDYTSSAEDSDAETVTSDWSEVGGVIANCVL